GWLLRGSFGVLALLAVGAGRLSDPDPWRDGLSLATALAAFVVLGVSVARKDAGVSGQRGRQERASARVAAMTGIDRAAQRFDVDSPEFPPRLDLIAPAIGTLGLLAAAVDAGGPLPLATVRFLVG